MAEHHFYRFFRRVSFPLPMELWRKMPRHPSFKHEYWDGKLHWTPRPKTCEVYLELDRWQPPPPGEYSFPHERKEITIRKLQEQDWQSLPRVFCMAASQWPPLSQWDSPAPRRAAKIIIEWARQGKDGPLVSEACFVGLARDRLRENEEASITGAAIVTLMATERLLNPPPNSPEFLPHLNWIFVTWMEYRRGVGTRLLESVITELRVLGHKTLASTVLVGPPAPMLWHWANGFRLPRGGG